MELFRAIGIETVNWCNRTCWFCKYGQPRESESIAFMSWELIEKIVLNLRALDYAGRVSWYRINEPLLDARMDDIVALTRRQVPRAFQSLLTNGDDLDDDRYLRLKRSGLDVLGVSLYDEAMKAKLDGLACRRELVVLDHRQPQERLFVESRGGNIRLPSGHPASAVNPFRDADCGRPSSMLNVLPDGRVVLCCCDFYGDVVTGDVRHQRLEDIWTGPTFTTVRRRLRDHGRTGLRLCEPCTHSGAPHARSYPLGDERGSLVARAFRRVTAPFRASAAARRGGPSTKE